MARVKSDMELVVKSFYERTTGPTSEGTVVLFNRTVYWSINKYDITLSVPNDDGTGITRTYRRPKGYGQMSMVLWAFMCQWIGKLSHKKLGYTGSTQIR